MGSKLQLTHTAAGPLAAAIAALLVLSLGGSLPVGGATPAPQSLAAPMPGYRLAGSAPQGLPVLVTIAIPLRNLGLLDSLVTQVSDPSSPLFRHFLTSQQVGKEFLPTASYNSLLQFMQANGFRVEMTALDSVIVAEGTVAQVESSFHNEVSMYTNGTYSYYVSSGAETFDGAYVYASNATFLFVHPASGVGARQNANVTFTSGTFSAKKLQPVYNATSLYSRGYSGSGETIGLLDFYGSPTIAGDLSLFDKNFGFPATTFNVIPIGPYDPNLGANVGWSTEVALDVEVSHAMAPTAAIDLYVANGALPFAPAIAKIVQDDKVTTLSQSFGVPEWYYSLSYYLGGPSFMALNALIPDQYYALGSIEGITFLASSGDAGGGGYSAGPEGGLEYPSTSPFVTSVGGTQTYFAASVSGNETFTQTAWSNIGFVPNVVNEGGGGGGVSILEPKPWYQQSQSTPATYPNGRLNPDLSLQAGVDPATLIVDSGQVVGVGGTSESSPLLAGLLTLLAQSSKSDLGLVNPFLYQVGNDPSLYTKGFKPITFGYTVPWTASDGYNLATGWGAPNVGELAHLLGSTATQPELSIRGSLVNASGLPQMDYTPGQVVKLEASINDAGIPVATGSFTATIQTLAGSFLTTPLTYNPGTSNWTASITMGQQSGLSYVYVAGSSGGVSGRAMGVLFAGYLGSIIAAGYPYILPIDPWTWGPANQLRIGVVSTDLNGNPAPGNPISMAVEPYSLAGNSYADSGGITLSPIAPSKFEGNLSATAPTGPVSLVLGGSTYGYAPTVNGIYLQTTYIYPEVAAEPGSLAPGQSLTIIANPIAPVNAYFATSYETGRLLGQDVADGSNVTATLVAPSGQKVGSTALYYQPCSQALKVCNGGASMLYGQLQVPADALPGLYTVLLDASYGSYTPGGNLTGSFYSQVLVSNGSTVPKITLTPATLYEGQTAKLVADISYPNGTEVKYGLYSAVVYPEALQGQYTTIMHTEYASSQLIPLSYDAGLNRWTGSVSLPSPYNSGSLSSIGGSSVYYAGPYEAYVSGLSADGVPTSAMQSAAQGFFVQPYIYVTDQRGPSSAQTSGLAFAGVIITSPQSLAGDIFLGSNTIQGADLSISASQIDGTLTVKNSHLTLIGVSGGDVVAQNSTLDVIQSVLGSLVLSNSNVTLSSSTYADVTPSLPTITIRFPSQGQVYTGASASVNVTGVDVSSVKAYLDGGLLATLPGGQQSYVYLLNAASLQDGGHTLTIVALQKDGLSSTSSVTFSTNAQRSQQNLELVGAAALGAGALVVAALALKRGRSRTPAGLPTS